LVIETKMGIQGDTQCFQFPLLPCSAIGKCHDEGVQPRYNFRLYPTAGQRVALARAFGCARVVFNDGLRARQDANAAGLPYICDRDLSKRVITEAKKTPERAWLGEVSAAVLQQALADLNTAYRNFFASLTGKRKGPKAAPPQFRSKRDNRQAIRFTRNARFSITADGRLRLPKIGDVLVRWSRSLPAEPSSVGQGRGWAVLRLVRRRDEAGPVAGVGR
jgi:transposase